MKSYLLLSFSILHLALCSAFAEGKLNVAVSILPQKFLVERIGEDKVSVTSLVGKGQSPATFDPTPKQMVEISNADLFFTIDVPFEKSWIPKIKRSYPKVQVINIASEIEPLKDLSEHAREHHASIDPHVWTTPTNAIKLAKTIHDNLTNYLPSDAELFSRNFKQLSLELEELDKELAGELKDVRNRDFFVFHPSWGHFAKQYGLIQHAIEIDGKEPSAKELAHIVAEAKQLGTKTIFIQREFDTTTAETIASAIGAKVEVINPLSEDYIENLKAATKLIKESLS